MIELKFSRRMAGMRPSTIREILKAAANPKIISFAGGLPAPELFPVEELRMAADRVLRESGRAALQYATTEGYPPLRALISHELRKRGISAGPEEILMTTGSQQALDLVAKAFIDPGDFVLTENPTYLAAIQVFQSYEANFAPVPTDEEGMIVEAIPELVRKHSPKLLYTIPNFQNPTGITLSLKRRKALIDTASRLGLIIVEDDPYGRLRYSGKDIPPVKSLDTEGSVIYLSTFSKTIAPGLRVGWATAKEPILRRLIVGKQAADLHASIFDQMLTHRYLADFDNESHVEKIRKAYGKRHAEMDLRLSESMPEGCSWTHPEGGMFLWVRLPDGADTQGLMEKALEREVLFVPGKDFFPDGSGSNYLRLNFSNSAPERIAEGVRRLGKLFRDEFA